MYTIIPPLLAWTNVKQRLRLAVLGMAEDNVMLLWHGAAAFCNH